MLRDFAQREWYLYPYLKERGIRFELPYQERIKRHGTQLANRLHEVGVEWWDKQLMDYDPLPTTSLFPIFGLSMSVKTAMTLLISLSGP